MDVNPTYRATVFRLVVPAGLIAAIAAGLIGALVILAAWGQDRVAFEDSISHVRAELNRLQRHLVATIEDYAYWDQAVENLVVKFDPVWADHNIGNYLATNRRINSSYVIAPDDSTPYAFSNDDDPEQNLFNRFAGGIEILVERTRQTTDDTNPTTVSGILRDGEHLHLVTASLLTTYHFEDDKQIAEPTDWILLLTVGLDAEILEHMAEHVWFTDLSVTFDAPPKGLPSLPITLLDGSEGGHLYWQSPTPGSEMLEWLLPTFGLVLAVLGGLAFVFVRSAIKTARSLEKQTAAVIGEKWRAETYLDIVGTMVVALDSNFRVLKINRKGRELLGYSENDLIGVDWTETIVPPENRAGVAEHLLALLAGGLDVSQHVENEVVTRSGERKLISWTNTIVRAEDGTITGTLSSGNDITEKRRAEEALLDFQARFQAILEHSPSAIFIKDTDGRFTFANEAFARRTSLTPAEVIGKTDFHFLDANTAARLQAVSSDIIVNHTTHNLEITVPTPEGPRTIVTVHFPILDGRGELTGIGGIGTDITEIEAARTSAQQLRSELAHVLRVRTAGEMASSFAHELNQPLTAIKNYVTGMTRRLRSGGAKPEEMTRVLEIVGEQAQRAGDIVRGIRNLVQRENGEFEDCNVNDAISEAVTLIANEAIHLDVRIETDLTEDLPSVPANTVQIQQTILNLARNAMEAMERAKVDRTRRVLTIGSAREDDGHIRISVSDSGQGIAENIGLNVFKPFFSTHGEGMGMGLPICRTIIEVHGGKIWFDSTAGKGTTFHFTLPTHLHPTEENTEAADDDD